MGLGVGRGVGRGVGLGVGHLVGRGVGLGVGLAKKSKQTKTKSNIRKLKKTNVNSVQTYE